MTALPIAGTTGSGCGYFDAGVCRSCTHLATPYADQVATKQARAEAALPPAVVWSPPVTSAVWGFRNKAKLVVGGTVDSPTLGILDGRRHGVDLQGCPLYSDALHALFPTLAALVARAGLTPYDVPARRGELKHLIVTEATDGTVMLRVVLRSTDRLDALRAELPWLLERAPQVRVVTANLLPEHKAVLEGDVEHLLTDADSITMTVNGLDLHLGPRAFFQTNTEVAAALYRQAVDWADELAPSRVLDLYCGVGGFALHLARRGGRRVRGVELSPDAVRAARRSAAAAGLDVDFEASDATADSDLDADLVVVNPPRRGLGPDLCGRLEASPARALLYSSCHLGSLQRDLADLPAYRATHARLLDMFPHTDHDEVLVRLERS